ncbi:MAG: hypothetical protein J5526_07455 [Bacteroidales bacterium]|nr:hypothetical protein [Bacteroidales bacterium]
MDKGIKYSDPLRSMWERFHDWSIRMHSQDANAFCNTVYQYALAIPNQAEQQGIMQQLNFWLKDYNGEFLHVWFEEKELYDFLQNDVALKELESIKQYLNVNGDHMTEKDLYDPSISYNYVRHDIALHVPDLEDGYAFSFCLMPDNTIAIFFADDDGVGQIHESEYNIAKSSKDEDGKSVERNFRFAVNLLAYMECFPECVRDGVPTSNNETVYQYKGKNVRLGISEKVLEEGLKGTKRPHMRKGYFKCLSSDFYKNKRGQIIFVRETMVKGKSKTVDMSGDNRKVDEFKHA